jgi:hypothetical protein
MADGFSITKGISITEDISKTDDESETSFSKKRHFKKTTIQKREQTARSIFFFFVRRPFITCDDFSNFKAPSHWKKIHRSKTNKR